MFLTLIGHTGIYNSVAIDAAQVIGRSRGGRTTKLDGLQDECDGPRMLVLRAGNVNDITRTAALVHAGGPIPRLLADRADDADHLRQLLARMGAEAVIPSRVWTCE